MSLEKLNEILPKPTAPVDVPEKAQWKPIEKSLQMELPSDYKALVETYGLGCIDGFFWVLNPVTRNKYLNLAKRTASTVKEWSMLRDKGVDIPYPLHPEPTGLIPWAITENGDRIHWLRKCGELAVVVEHNGLAFWDEFALGTTDFLVKMLGRELTIRAFPNDFPGESHRLFRVGEDYFEWLKSGS